MGNTKEQLKNLAEDIIKCETRVALRGDTVILETREQDGSLIKHYHHYENRKKAEKLYEWWCKKYALGN